MCPKYTPSFRDAPDGRLIHRRNLTQAGVGWWTMALVSVASRPGIHQRQPRWRRLYAWPPAPPLERLCTRSCCRSTGCLRASRLAGTHWVDHSVPWFCLPCGGHCSSLIVNMSYKGPHSSCSAPFTPLPQHCCPQAYRAPSSQAKTCPIAHESVCLLEAVFSCSQKVWVTRGTGQSPAHWVGFPFTAAGSPLKEIL